MAMRAPRLGGETPGRAEVDMDGVVRLGVRCGYIPSGGCVGFEWTNRICTKYLDTNIIQNKPGYRKLRWALLLTRG